MERLNKKEVDLLLQKRGEGLSISLYMPTLRGREGSMENPIRFKNLIAKVENELAVEGLSQLERQKILEPAHIFVNESYFWSNQSKGLAFFLSNGFYRYYRLPIEFNERAVVKNSFYLKPLFNLLSSDKQFYVLALSQKDARLLRGTRDTIEEMDLSEVIQRFEEKFGKELPEQSLQFHTRTQSAGSGPRAAIFYGGSGDLNNIQKERLRKYFRFIDQELHQMVDEKNVPLLLACVEELTPLYREISKYPLLMEQTIDGNPDNMKAQEIYQRAGEIMEPYFQKKLEEAKSQYYELKGTGKTSNNLQEILPASFHGRTRDLFVNLDEQQWGWYYHETGEIAWGEESLPDNEELLDLAATEAYVNNGNIFALKSDEMPDSEPISTIFRW